MTSLSGRAPDDTPGTDAWEEEGRRLGDGLDDAHLVLVLGRDPRETALAALGVARAQAAKRRVALGDLLGDAEPIHRLLPPEDHHGLVDSFLYGVSINKIAVHVPEHGELYVLPSGSDVPPYDEIFTHNRWQRLASGFHETGALLVVAAPISAAHVGDVALLGDGVVLVGDAEMPGTADGKLLGRVPGIRTPPSPVAALADMPAPRRELQTPEPVEALGTERPPRWWNGRRATTAAAGAGLAALLAAMGIWLAARPLVRGPRPARSTGTAAGALPSAFDSSSAADSIARAAVAAPPALSPANPADSAAASSYAVALMTTNTQAGAILWFQNTGQSLPAATFSPVLVQGATWFRVIVGAYPNRAQADSLLGALRARGEVRTGLGDVVSAPYAFLVDSVRAEAVAGLLKYFAERGQPVYALRQADGSARLYAGAFETREQASLYVESVRASGIRPVLVYRIGRVNQ